MRAWDAAKVNAALELLEAAAPVDYTGNVHVHFKGGTARVFDPSGHTTRDALELMVDGSKNRRLISAE